MSTQIQTLVRSLAAAGFAPKGETDLRLLDENKNKLVEKVWNGVEFNNQILVTSNVKSNTPAVYLLAPDESIFCIDKANALKYLKHNGKKWEAKTLDGIETPIVHAGSKLAGQHIPGGMLVFYQDPEGSIQVIAYSEESKKWTKGSAISENVAPGTPLFASPEGSKLSLYYLNENGDVHSKGQDIETGEWEDKIHATVDFDGPIDGFIVTQSEKPENSVGWFLTNNKLMQVFATPGGETKVTELGTWKGDVYSAKTKAEDTYNVYGNVYQMGGWGCGPCYPPPRRCPRPWGC